MIPSELSRPVKLRALSQEPFEVTANASERAALARRFDVVSIESLSARLTLTPQCKEITAEGKLSARWTQNCAVSGDNFSLTQANDIALRFVPAREILGEANEEIEISAADCDEIDYQGDSFDLGEAVAQSFGLMIDPYAAGPNADKVRKEKGIAAEGEENGPLAELLSGLKIP